MPTPPAARPAVAVAYSGGRDSTALLHATAHAGLEAGVRVLALHVHHGLLAGADDWLAHCARQCAAWKRRGLPVEFFHRRLELRPARGESVEALARKARYKALREMAAAQGAQAVMLAHHRRDQAETFLLQALRGAGVAGLSAMPQAVEREGITWLRPWLEHPREAVEAYVRAHRLRFIDDDSNDDTRFARNRLRHGVWPALTLAFPEADAVLADAARWAQDASACLAELASIDLAAVGEGTGEGGAEAGGVVTALRTGPLLALGAPRARNALRAWFRAGTGRPLPASLLERLIEELPRVRSARWAHPGGQLWCHRGRLTLEGVASVVTSRGAASSEPVHAREAAPAAVRKAGPGAAHDAAHQAAPGASLEAAPASDSTLAVPRAISLSIRRAGRYRLRGWGGCIRAARVTEGGVALALLGELQVRARSGGEQFQSGPGRPARSLKKQFQASGLPAWARGGPLLWAGNSLVFVPGLGLDARALAAPGEPQLTLRWEPDAGA